MANPPHHPTRIALALQGGGSHGAFTWGVLDRLLDERGIEIEAASGASAGAINAALLAHGLALGNNAHAKTALSAFWQGLAGHAPVGAAEYGLKALMMMTRWLSPPQWNPLDLNPLRTLLASSIDVERVRTRCPLQLYIAATRVDTGTLRVFHTRELSIDVLLASACLPWLHHTIEIDGTSYWDGGLVANPPLYSLVDHCTADDLVLVTMHPSRRVNMPKQADEISARVAEINFTAAFFAELQGVLTAQRAARRQWFPIGRTARRLRRLRVHVIDGGDLTAAMPAASRMNVERSFIEDLFQHGRARAQEWLDRSPASHANWSASIDALLFPR